MNTAVDIRQEDSNIIPASDAPMVAMIERIVMDPSIPIDRLEQMLAMKERMEDRARDQLRENREYEAKTAYFKAMSECQKELPVVIKTKTNKHTNSTYADLAAIEDQAMPVIYAHGFGVSFQPDGYNDLGELRINWEISHSGGYVRNGTGAIPVDGAGAKGGVNKTGTQAFGSTATYGRRYLLCMLFNISTGDDRDGNRTEDNGAISEEQVRELWKIIENVGAHADKFCEIYEIDAIPDLPARLFNDAMKNLLAYGQRKKQANGGPAQ